jgi:hypothetical protein
MKTVNAGTFESDTWDGPRDPLLDSDIPPMDVGTLRPLPDLAAASKPPGESRSADAPAANRTKRRSEPARPHPLFQPAHRIAPRRTVSARAPSSPPSAIPWIAAGWFPIAVSLYFLAAAQPPSTFLFFDRLAGQATRTTWDTSQLVLAGVCLAAGWLVASLGVLVRWQTPRADVPVSLVGAATAGVLGLAALAFSFLL